MTKAMLIRRMIAVAAVVLLLVGGAVCGRIFGGAAGLEFYVIVTDFIELEIALIAVYIANVFQQRAFFVRGLRQLWSDIIVAKNDLITYTHVTTPDRDQYGGAHRSISRAIDEMRGVYRNIGESETERGKYPYAPLHDMRLALKALGHDEPDAETRRLARHRILRAWNALRYKFRLEFEPVEPTRPITEPFSRDPYRADRDIEPPLDDEDGKDMP